MEEHDQGRFLLVSPELADVLSTVIHRVRNHTGKIPVITSYDWQECVWLPPSPLLFQRRFGAERRRISPDVVRDILAAALVRTGLSDPSTGEPLRFTPHDFRRLFITDAIMSGLPPHIAQVIAGHRDINVTMGYKAVYPDEAIRSHLAFLSRRRAMRPTDEYRVPTDAEWREFLGHFERRKVSTGICGRAVGTPCVHEHSCLRCSMHWPDPAQRQRITEIRDNLIARIAEAEREGWLGEVEGLRISLTGANDKLAQIDRRSTDTAVDLGLPDAQHPEPHGRGGILQFEKPARRATAATLTRVFSRRSCAMVSRTRPSAAWVSRCRAANAAVVRGAERRARSCAGFLFVIGDLAVLVVGGAGGLGKIGGAKRGRPHAAEVVLGFAQVQGQRLIQEPEAGECSFQAVDGPGGGFEIAVQVLGGGVVGRALGQLSPLFAFTPPIQQIRPR